MANTTSSSLPAIINEKKMPVFWTRNKSGVVDSKVVTGRQNCREERTGETKLYLDEKLLIDGTLSGAPNGPMFPNTPEVFQMVLPVL